MSICMCTGNCPISDTCHRYMKKVNPCVETFSSLEDICIPNGYSEWIPYRKTNSKRSIKYTLDDFIMDEIRKNKTN